jgi:hypothetical protein
MSAPIKAVILPKSELGNDASDYRDDPTYLDKLKPKPPINPLDTFVLNGESEAMKAKMLDDKYILGRMALLGQSTAFYAKPNAGKTLLTVWLLIESIKAGNINPSDVYYFNADDNHKGITYKLSLAERYGFLMLAPGYHGFKTEMLPGILFNLVENDIASGKILILDTLKKFTDIMNKSATTKFGNGIRQFVSKGGSVIMLAHVNKHNDSEGNVVYAGTSDIVDDADCCYTLQIIEETADGKVIEFTNFKDRGDVAKKALFTYSNTEGVMYGDLLDSVIELDDQESKRIVARNAMRDLLEKNESIINAMTDAITNGVNTKTELIKEVRDATGESKKRIIDVLTIHTGTNTKQGKLWSLRIEGRNAHTYELNNPVFHPNQGGV